FHVNAVVFMSLFPLVNFVRQWRTVSADQRIMNPLPFHNVREFNGLGWPCRGMSRRFASTTAPGGGVHLALAVRKAATTGEHRRPTPSAASLDRQFMQSARPDYCSE